MEEKYRGIVFIYRILYTLALAIYENEYYLTRRI